MSFSRLLVNSNQFHQDFKVLVENSRQKTANRAGIRFSLQKAISIVFSSYPYFPNQNYVSWNNYGECFSYDKMYARKASELVKELTCSEPGQLSAFNSDLFAQVIEECNGHLLHLGPLIRKIEELKKKEEQRKMNNQELDETDKNALKASSSGALIHHLSLLRNKRCLMAYVYHRAEIVRSLGWTVERVLPEEIGEKISSSEKEYFKNHTATLQSYMSELDLDLAVDMVPPKDPYIKVRVLDEIGNVVLSDQSANLARHAILFLRRTDAEQYIAQGLMEELTG